MMSDVLSPAYVLHSRKYQDSSLIVELLTRDEGRISAVVRGAKNKRGRQAGVWQPFMPLLVSSFGRGELRTVKHAEFLQTAFHLTGDNLLLGLYVNELLVRVLGKFEAVPEVFGEYQTLLNELATIDGVPGELANSAVATGCNAIATRIFLTMSASLSKSRLTCTVQVRNIIDLPIVPTRSI